MDTLTVAFADTCPVLFGRSSFRAFGFTRVEVTRKNISRRNTMSVIDDIENSDSALVFRLIAISFSAYFPVSALPASASDCPSPVLPLRISMKSIV